MFEELKWKPEWPEAEWGQPEGEEVGEAGKHSTQGFGGYAVLREMGNRWENLGRGVMWTDVHFEISRLAATLENSLERSRVEATRPV